MIKQINMKKLFVLVTSLICMLEGNYGQAPVPAESTVKIWEESVTLPTYLVDPPGLNPRFYNGRAYQGAQGRVYPYPIYESLSDTRVDKEYDMVFLENEYIRIELLPEVGGRLFGALDKTNNFDFIYRQHVIKPQLIGMLGAWISGGIEWNFPHHHRATAFMPVDYLMEENPDGSATVWIGELEIRHRMKFMLGVSVYPGKSYFEITFRPINKTPFPHSFLYFANIGVHTNEDYQVIFPPSTQFGTYHGKNQFVHWPIADEVYNRVEYNDGVDISWWKNHPEWTSIFCWNYEDDFVGGYDHVREAGTLCFSNHHIAPGKKFWTWSTGPRGQMWDAALTETDGPELELMIGGYSDNQPDYSWLQPYESKFLKQYLYPIREIGGVKKANLNAAVNLELKDNKAKVGFNTTSERNGAKVILYALGQIIYEESINIDPAQPYMKKIRIPEGTQETDLRIVLVSAEGEELISYSPVKLQASPIPDVAKPPKPPGEIQTIEELYYTGLRLEQFYNPSFKPEPYYQEALARDSIDYRVNIAVGLLYLRRGLYSEAEKHLQRAVDRITHNYTKPRDGEGYYYLGLCQKYQGNLEAAYKNLYQATWSYAYHSAAYYQLAQLDCRKGSYIMALNHVNRSLSTNSKNTCAHNLKSAIFRKLGKYQQSLEIAMNNSRKDPLDFWSLFEINRACRALGDDLKAQEARQTISSRMSDYVQWYIELSLEYAHAGLWDDAISFLSMIDKRINDKGSDNPMVYYYLGFYNYQKEEESKAMEYFNYARKQSPDYVFPFRLESIEVLELAMKVNPDDPRAPYYLGNLLFEKQPERAITNWELSKKLDDSYSMVFRNLGIGHYRTFNDIPGTIKNYERAIKLNPDDQRLLFELDLIYAAGRVEPEKRLNMLQDHHEVITNNNVSDALSREVMLLVQLKKYDEALNVINNNYFKQWEGISKAYNSYVDAHLLKGLEHFNERRYDLALSHYAEALKFPANMMVAEPYRGGRLCEVYYHMGTAYERLKESDKTLESFENSVDRRQLARLSDSHYYRAKALQKLGKEDEAQEIFNGLIDLGRRQLESPDVDFFAKFGEQRTRDDMKADAYYLLGLGYLGKGMTSDAKRELEAAVRLNINHVWAAALQD